MTNTTPNTQQADSVRCGTCAIHDLCLAHGVDKATPAHKPLQRIYLPQTAAGAHIFWAGDEFRSLYAVKSGCIKTYTVDDEGNERVRGFYLPGDLLGLDAIYTGIHPANAVAVAPSNICALPYASLTQSVANLPDIQGRLMSLMSKDLFTALSLGGDYTAEQRLAAFFLHLQERELNRRMTSSDRVDLPMSRRDIASYLRLAPETVSRVLARFQQAGWIESRPRALSICQRAPLEQLAVPVGILAQAQKVARAA